MGNFLVRLTGHAKVGQVVAEALGFGREGTRVLLMEFWGSPDHLLASPGLTLTQPHLPPNKADGSPLWCVEQGAGLWDSGGGSGGMLGARAAVAT